MLRRSVIWVDAQGKTRQTLLRGSATLLTVMSSVKSVSNADVLGDFEGTETINGTPVPVAAAYATVNDFAVLTYETGAGTLVYITVPAPLSSIFLADGETVDATAIAALTTAVVGTVTDASGNAVTAFVAGVRRKLLKEYQ